MGELSPSNERTATAAENNETVHPPRRRGRLFLDNMGPLFGGWFVVAFIHYLLASSHGVFHGVFFSPRSSGAELLEYWMLYIVLLILLPITTALVNGLGIVVSAIRRRYPSPFTELIYYAAWLAFLIYGTYLLIMRVMPLFQDYL